MTASFRSIPSLIRVCIFFPSVVHHPTTDDQRKRLKKKKKKKNKNLRFFILIQFTLFYYFYSNKKITVGKKCEKEKRDSSFVAAVNALRFVVRMLRRRGAKKKRGREMGDGVRRLTLNKSWKDLLYVFPQLRLESRDESQKGKWKGEIRCSVDSFCCCCCCVSG